MTCASISDAGYYSRSAAAANVQLSAAQVNSQHSLSQFEEKGIGNLLAKSGIFYDFVVNVHRSFLDLSLRFRAGGTEATGHQQLIHTNGSRISKTCGSAAQPYV